MENKLASTDIKRGAIKSLFWKITERGSRAFVELAVQIVMARLLAPELFGALAIMLVFVNIGNIFVQSGLNTALVQSPKMDDSDCSTVYWISLTVSAVLYLCVFFAAPSIASFYQMDAIIWPLRALALILIINAYNAVQIAIVQRELKFRIVFNAAIASSVLSGLIGVISAVFGAELWALVLQQLTYQTCNCFVMAAQVDWQPRLVFNSKRARELFSFGWKLLVSGVLDQGYQSLSDLIIGKQFSASSLGLVSQGKNIRRHSDPCLMVLYNL